MDQIRLQRRQDLVRRLFALSDRPGRALAGLAALLLSVELVLLVLHLVAAVALADLAAGTKDGTIGGFDLNAEGTLAAWFSSFQLLLLSLACLFASWSDRGGCGLFARHRFWKLGFLLFLFMSIDETACFHEMFGGLMSRFLPRVPLSPSMWWTIPYGLAIGTWLLFCGCRCIKRPGLLGLGVLGAASWLVANALDHVHVFSLNVNVLIEEGLEMFGATAFLLAVLLFLAACHRFGEHAAGEGL